MSLSTAPFFCPEDWLADHGNPIFAHKVTSIILRPAPSANRSAPRPENGSRLTTGRYMTSSERSPRVRSQRTRMSARLSKRALHAPWAARCATTLSRHASHATASSHRAFPLAGSRESGRRRRLRRNVVMITARRRTRRSSARRTGIGRSGVAGWGRCRMRRFACSRVRALALRGMGNWSALTLCGGSTAELYQSWKDRA